MIKPNQLRDHLLTALPELAKNPDRLLIFVDEGRMVNTLANGLSFEYRYTINLIITDFSEDLAVLAVALFAWLREHQPELMVNLGKSADSVKFIADIVDNQRCDLSITMPLTERVIVKEDRGEAVYSYPAEPTASQAQPKQTIKIVNAKSGQVLGSFTSGEPEQHRFLSL